jgi:surface antigen
LSTLATKFGVTSESIRWSNSLTSERIDPGKVLIIPPVSGIVYIVKAGDTADTLASRYASNKDQILADNDAEVAGLKVGQRILIRGGIQPVARTAAATSTTGYATGGFAFGTRAIFGYNGYDYGYCTWYVANKRASIGRALPANLGNANTWDDRAPQGYNQTPAYGAAVVTGQRAPGHVAFVEEVYPDGSVRVSEMNTRGWGVRSERTYDAATASKYNYIH